MSSSLGDGAQLAECLHAQVQLRPQEGVQEAAGQCFSLTDVCLSLPLPYLSEINLKTTTTTLSGPAACRELQFPNQT